MRVGPCRSPRVVAPCRLGLSFRGRYLRPPRAHENAVCSKRRFRRARSGIRYCENVHPSDRAQSGEARRSAALMLPSWMAGTEPCARHLWFHGWPSRSCRSDYIRDAGDVRQFDLPAQVPGWRRGFGCLPALHDVCRLSVSRVIRRIEGVEKRLPADNRDRPGLMPLTVRCSAATPDPGNRIELELLMRVMLSDSNDQRLRIGDESAFDRGWTSGTTAVDAVGHCHVPGAFSDRTAVPCLVGKPIGG